MLWGTWEPKISGVSLWHVCKAVLLYIWKDQSHVLVLFYLTVTLKYGSVFCIYSSVSNISAFGVVFPVSVMTGAAASVCGVGSLDECCWAVLLLVLNAGPSECVANSMLIVVSLFWGKSTRYDRHSAALLYALNIYSKEMWYVASSCPHLLTLLFAFFPFRNLASGLWSFLTIILDPWR